MFYQNEFLPSIWADLKIFDVLKNMKRIYGLNAIFENMKRGLFNNISKKLSLW